MKFHINFFDIKLQISNAFNIDDIMQKMQCIEFNIAPMEEDKEIVFKQGC